MATAKEKTAKKTTAAKSPRKTARKIVDREDKIYAEADVKAEEKAIRQVKRTQKKDVAEISADIGSGSVHVDACGHNTRLRDGHKITLGGGAKIICRIA